MELSGKRVGIFVEKMYQEFEFWYPYFRMKEAGAKVSIIGTGAKEYSEPERVARSRGPVLQKRERLGKRGCGERRRF